MRRWLRLRTPARAQARRAQATWTHRPPVEALAPALGISGLLRLGWRLFFRRARRLDASTSGRRWLRLLAGDEATARGGGIGRQGRIDVRRGCRLQGALRLDSRFELALSGRVYNRLRPGRVLHPGHGISPRPEPSPGAPSGSTDCWLGFGGHGCNHAVRLTAGGFEIRRVRSATVSSWAIKPGGRALDRDWGPRTRSGRHRQTDRVCPRMRGARWGRGRPCPP